MYPANTNPFEPAKISPIIQPGTPERLRVLVSGRGWSHVSTTFKVKQAALALGPFVVAGPMFFAASPFPSIGAAVLVVSMLAIVIATFLGFRQLGPRVVSSTDYAFRGVPIEAASLDMLADIQNRFEWAEKMFEQVPTGIRWDEVEDQVQVLMWEAAGFAAKTSALDVEVAGLVYAPAGSPQGALRRELQRKRGDIWTRLLETQREADDLAREASNTAAAARIALARTGSVFDLEMLTPSGANLVARGTLAAARARLALLADVWTELDETGAILDARFEEEQPRQLPSGD